ncbi:ATP-binding protein [Photobacterium phosphoreum]|jgi:two-component system phosphoglycerate transport system sensor histidine kinase PgtB|uniref:ATP-binding protein n=1 Tax=Photobacterium phosphoreum TaxID=659 RepID=UPI000D153419|nr:ATP-binding protein [Photobacterium phosphoreum]MCD9464048.1 histidine kinase [Photobacterium phosphoreum]MCD9472198.1 histidine kinase [Photobacterium phosphoreum]MCD9511801.1 HAMP domain-containing protein [Photobacterium phosphoreum]PSU61786.1 histidine kinase [Photobacterium phosphoreum]PSU61837.1 histidine kinase [Photobacterium phosphoreum]
MIRCVKNNTIGNRLTSAIILMAFLTISVSVIAALTWQKLSQQIGTIANDNMPTLRASYRLERSTAELQAALTALDINTNPLKHKAIKKNISAILTDIHQSIDNISSLYYYPKIKAGQQRLVTNIDNYIDLLQHRNTQKLALKQTENTIKWLHQDLIDELQPLRLEIEWQMMRLLNNPQQSPLKHDSNIKSVMTELSIIQTITVNENELYQLIADIILHHQHNDINSAFDAIAQKVIQLNKISKQLNNYPSTIAYRQLQQEFTQLVIPNSNLQKLLVNSNLNNIKITQAQRNIRNKLTQQENIIQTLVNHADNALEKLNGETRHSIWVSNLVLFGVVFITIILSIILSIYVVGRGVVKRLNLLGKDLKAIASGDLNTNIQTTGVDEIGILGDNLRYFCQQMQEIQNSNALNLINNTQASIITCDLNGAVESVNPQALKQLNFCNVTKKHQVWDLFNTSTQTKLQLLFTANGPLMANGAYNMTIKLVTKHNHSLYLRLDFRTFTQGNDDKVIITMTDITEQENTARWLESTVAEKTQSLTIRNQQLRDEIEDRKRIEGDLIETQDELIQAAKMAVVGQTMTSLAHELNQPLSAISTRIFSAKLALDHKKYENLPKNLTKIDDLVTRMSKLIISFRNFAKKQSATKPLSQVDIQDSIKQALILVESRAKVQKITIVNTIEQPLYALADQVQLEQILVNLLVNSCDAVAHCEQRKIDIIQLSGPSNKIRLAVYDSGDGFDATIIEKLFIPFTTTKDVGLGLGLSICGSIMTRLKGDIFLASSLSGGAMVVLELNKYDE